MKYFFYPPFFRVAEEHNFPDAWESFCLKLLIIHEQTNEIHRREHPDQGIDLYYSAKQIAYQCKCVESGKSGDLNVKNIIESIRTARKVKARLGWKKYVLCVNVDVIGVAEEKIRKELPDIIIHSKSFWLHLCEKNTKYVERNFRLLLEIPLDDITTAIHNQFSPRYSKEIKRKLKSDEWKRNAFDIFVFLRMFDRLYRLKVVPDLKVKDLISVFKQVLGLPDSKTITVGQVSVSLSYSILFNGEKYSDSTSLKELNINPGSVIMLLIGYNWKDGKDSLDCWTCKSVFM